MRLYDLKIIKWDYAIIIGVILWYRVGLEEGLATSIESWIYFYFIVFFNKVASFLLL